MAVDYFQSLFTSSAQSFPFEENYVTKKLLDGDINFLNEPFTQEEIQKAIQQMPP